MKTPLGVLTLAGYVDGADSTSSLLKRGLGTLAITNNSGFSGGVRVEAGTLLFAGLNGSAAAPIGGGNLTLGNAGLVQLFNSGVSSFGVISYSTPLVVSGSATAGNLQLGNNGGSNVSNTIELSTVNMTGGQILNVAANNSYNLRVLSLATTGSTPVKINPQAGTTVTIYDYGTDESLRPINIGQGLLVFPDLLTIGTSSLLDNSGFSGGTLTMGGSTPPMVVKAATFTQAAATAGGYAAGGLSGYYAVGAAGYNLVSPQNAGIASAWTRRHTASSSTAA